MKPIYVECWAVTIYLREHLDGIRNPACSAAIHRRRLPLGACGILYSIKQYTWEVFPA